MLKLLAGFAPISGDFLQFGIIFFFTIGSEWCFKVLTVGVDGEMINGGDAFSVEVFDKLIGRDYKLVNFLIIAEVVY